MKEAESLRAHLLICTHRREGGKASCAARGAEALRDAVKARAAREMPPEARGQFRVNASGCLDRCEEGIAAALYPCAKWWTGIVPGEDSERALVAALRAEWEQPR